MIKLKKDGFGHYIEGTINVKIRVNFDDDEKTEFTIDEAQALLKERLNELADSNAGSELLLRYKKEIKLDHEGL